jgi:hypothetical protein
MESEALGSHQFAGNRCRSSFIDPWNLNLAVNSSGVIQPLPDRTFRPPPALHRYPLCASLLFLFLLNAPSFAAQSRVQSVTFKIPPTNIPLKVKDDEIAIIASANIVLRQQSHGLNILTLDLTADLSGLQQHFTDLLSSQLDKDDRCGDRIAIQNATLTPAAPAALAVVQLHYERWGCAKVFGKQQSKRLVGGNAVIPMTLTPAVEEDRTQLRLVPTVGQIQADGSLGELLRSGTLGEMLQEKIHKAILNAMQKGTDLSATLPPAVQGYATIENAQFKDAGSGRLLVLLSGKIQITNDQIQALAKQVKERVAAAQ